MDILTKHQWHILNQLRTGHIKLNFYFHMINHRQYYQQININNNLSNIYYKCKSINPSCIKCNFGFCSNCDELETVLHYLLQCTKYIKQRHYMMHKIDNIFMKYNELPTLKNILFCPVQFTPMHRKEIYSAIIKYVNQTKRIKYYNR